MEHLAWLADNGIVSYSSTLLWSVACYLWGVGVLAMLIFHLQKLIKSWFKTYRSRKAYAASKRNDSAVRAHNHSSLINQNFTVALSVIQNAADLIIAAEYSHFHGRLWQHNQSFGNLIIGLAGFISSIIGLLKIIPAIRGYF